MADRTREDSTRRSLVGQMRREAIESTLFALLGGVGVVLGASSWRPMPTVARQPPVVAAPPGGFADPPARSDRIVAYTIHATLDPTKHTIDGTETVTLTNASSAPLLDLRLHLYLNAFKNDRTVFRRARVAGFRGGTDGEPGLIDVQSLTFEGHDLWPKRERVTHVGESPEDPLSKPDTAVTTSAPARTSPKPTTIAMVDGAPDDETDMRVPLPHAIAPGDAVTFQVAFHDELPEVSERTGYKGSFHFAGQWFPKLAKLEPDGAWATFAFQHLGEFYADYGHYDVTIDVPSSFVVGATGPLVEAHEDQGRHIERHVVDDVHDFAWTAWDRFVVHEGREGGVAIRLLSPPGYDSIVARELESVRHGLREFGARFGAYPYSVLTVVHPPDDAQEAGGMEYPTLITTGGRWMPTLGAHDIENVTIHELGHQWFYGLIGTNEVEWPAGDEGFNSYAEVLAMKSFFGAGGAIATGPLRIDELLFQRAGVMPTFDEPVFQAVPRFANGSSYGRRVYGATATILLTLRRTYGEAPLDRAMGVYARRFRFAHPHPDDFFRVLEDEVGRRCADAARLALTQPFGLDVYVDRIESAEAKGPKGIFETPSGRVKKTGDEVKDPGFAQAVWLGRRGLVDLPVDVELRFADGTREVRTVEFGTVKSGADALVGPPVTWLRLDADGPSELVAVVLDPFDKIPMDRSRLDNFTVHGALGTRGWTRERSVAWAQMLASAIGP